MMNYFKNLNGFKLFLFVSCLIILLINVISIGNINTPAYTITYTILLFAVILSSIVILLKESFISVKGDKKFLIILLALLALAFAMQLNDLTIGGIHVDEYTRLDRGRTIILDYNWSAAIFGAPLEMILDGVASLCGGYNPYNIEFVTRFLLGAVLSTLTIFIVALIGCEIKNNIVGLLSAFFLTFSFEFFRLSKTFVSDPKIAFFAALMILSFFVSLRRQKYIYLTFVFLGLLLLLKATSLAIFPYIIFIYAYYTYAKKFQLKDMVMASLLCIIIGAYFSPNVFIMGNIFAFIGGQIMLIERLHAFATPFIINFVIILFIMSIYLIYIYICRKNIFQISINKANTIYLICLIGLVLVVSIIFRPSLDLLIFHFYNLFTYDKLLFIGAIGTFIIALYYRDEKPVILCICGISSIVFVTLLGIVDGRIFHRHLSSYIPLFAIMAGYVSYILYRKISMQERNKSHYRNVAYVVLLIVLALQVVNLYNFGYTAKGEGFNIYGSGIKEVVEQLNNEVDINEKVLLYIPIHFRIAQFYDANKFTTQPIGTRLIPIKAGGDYKRDPQWLLSPYNNSVSTYIEENDIKYILNRPSGFPYDSFPTIEEILSNSSITTIRVKAFSPINVINIADLRRTGRPTLLKVEPH